MVCPHHQLWSCSVWKPWLPDMSATLRLSGALRQFNAGKTEAQVVSGRTVRETLIGLGIVPETIAMVVVNEEQNTKDYLIKDGDVIMVLAIIGGG